MSSHGPVPEVPVRGATVRAWVCTGADNHVQLGIGTLGA